MESVQSAKNRYLESNVCQSSVSFDYFQKVVENSTANCSFSVIVITLMYRLYEICQNLRIIYAFH